MSFLNRLNEIVKPKVVESKYDFGLGDGEETLYFRKLNYTDRKRIIQDRLIVTGKDAEGNDQFGFDRAEMNNLNAEMLAASWVKDDGKPVATKEAFMKDWDADLVDALASVCMLAVGSAKKSGEGTDADPSTGQS